MDRTAGLVLRRRGAAPAEEDAPALTTATSSVYLGYDRRKEDLVKTAISVPDALHESIETFIQVTKVTRREFY